MRFINDKKVWLFLMILAIAVSGIYLFGNARQDTKVYAEGRLVEETCPEFLLENIA